MLRLQHRCFQKSCTIKNRSGGERDKTFLWNGTPTLQKNSFSGKNDIYGNDKYSA
jgi:hypothetical protein